MKTRFFAQYLACVPLLLASQGRASIAYGSINNFDTVNDTGTVCHGFEIEIDDGSGPIQVFLYPGTGISTAGLVPGAKIDTSCFSSQFDTTYECDPPSAAAFHVEP